MTSAPATRSRTLRYATMLAAGAMLAAGLPLAAGPAGPAQAFGTQDIPRVGIHGEHEMVTRTLSRSAEDGGDERTRFQPATLDRLAGTGTVRGAVGAPDDPEDSSPIQITGYGPSYKHCGDADHLPLEGYPRTRGQADRELTECIDYFEALMDRAVRFAGRLVGPDNQLNVAMTVIKDCEFGWTVDERQPAKCEFLNAFGRALHLVEDFWAHSNWGDAKAAGPVSLMNPPGLGRTDVPDFLRYPVPGKYDIPDELITGCDDSLVSPKQCRSRVTHSVLAKDTGWIDKDTGKATPETRYPRGRVATNFQDAVRGARKQVRATWADLQAAIVDTYGQVRGERIIDAIVRDAPWSPCNLHRGDAGSALDAPEPNASGTRSTRVRIENQTDAKLHCTVATLDWGEWARGPEHADPGETAVLRTVSGGIAIGTEGEVGYRIGSSGPRDEVTIHWNNPFLGANTYRCQVPAGYQCTRVGDGTGNSADVTFRIRRR